jgi:hypothetical protein
LEKNCHEYPGWQGSHASLPRGDMGFSREAFAGTGIPGTREFSGDPEQVCIGFG